MNQNNVGKLPDWLGKEFLNGNKLMIEPRTKSFRIGFSAKPGSLWVGAHWSKHNRRLCVNLVPCLTVWFVLAGGVVPVKS